MHFGGYVSLFLIQSDLKNLTAIKEVCEVIVFNEFELVVSADDYISFERNTIKYLSEYLIEVLSDIGNPAAIDVIENHFNNKYPEVSTKKDSIRNTLTREKECFIFFGRSGTYGLKKWEQELENIKGGTIRDLVEEYLMLQTNPKHINEICDYVFQFRKTNAYSVMSNIKADTSNRFINFGSDLVGLRVKDYALDTKKSRRISGSHFRLEALKGFNGWDVEEVYKHFNSQYGYKRVQIKHIIENKIRNQELSLSSENKLIV